MLSLLIKCFFYGLTISSLTEIWSSNAQIYPHPNPIREALFFHNTSINNNTREDCVWRKAVDKDACPDEAIKFYLYAGGEREEVDQLNVESWLQQSSWEAHKEDVFLIHGYAGGDEVIPMNVLRDAYIHNGSYNVWIVDWGALAEPPCYPAAVHNMKTVGKCAGDLLTSLRAAGLRTERTTCVGHSLGAHVCGLITHNILFRMHRIMSLDPARPLVPNAVRLNGGFANAVHVLHTNAGHYGESGRSGHVDFCINGGKSQPYCSKTANEPLCSHIWVICYMAESLNGVSKMAEPCSRRCPTGPRPGHRLGKPIVMGWNTPLTATGSYCIHDDVPPYCPMKAGDVGDKRCCIDDHKFDGAQLEG